MPINTLLLLALLISTALLTVAVDSKENDLAWQRWKQRYGKRYTDSAEEGMRRDIWQKQVDEITEHNLRFNMGLESYQQGLNKFSDLTWDEFREAYLMTDLADQDKEEVTMNDQPRVDANDVPKSIDWREKGYVTPVKEQQKDKCKSSWAISVAGTMEGQLANKTGKEPVSLSAQQQIDCCNKTAGCRGGWPHKALEYTQQNGLESEESYPYMAHNQSCGYNNSNVVFKNSGMIFHKAGGEWYLTQMVVHNGPTSVTMRVSPDFMKYKSGIFITKECNWRQPQHSVLVVGYGTLDKHDYWMVKNCWGEDWGEKGYVMMARNNNNMCSIAYWPVVAVI